MAIPRIKPGKRASRSWRQRKTAFGTADPYRENTDHTMVNDLENAQASVPRVVTLYNYAGWDRLTRTEKRALRSYIHKGGIID